jgi:outer membrane protein insertion porin family
MRVAGRLELAWLAVAGLAVALVWVRPAHAQAAPSASGAQAVPRLRPPPALGSLAGRPIARIEVVPLGKRWAQTAQLERVRVGDPLSLEVARRAMRELLDSGRYASARAQAIPDGPGVILRIFVLARRLIATVKVIGGSLDEEDTLRAAEVREGGELTELELPTIARRVTHYYGEHGFPAARVRVDTIDTDDPMRVVLLINVDPGAPLLIAQRVFQVAPFPAAPGLDDLLDDYDAGPGDRVDEERLASADRALERDVRAHGWFRATVEHRIHRQRSAKSELVVTVRAGPLMRLRFWGNRHFDASQLEPALEIKSSEDRTTGALVQRLHDFYVQRGFLDVEVTADERGAPGAAIHDLVFTIREHHLVHVTVRQYPCLTGPRSPKDVGSELDDVLSDELPGDEVVGSVDPTVVDETFGPRHPTGARVVPFEPNPLRTYVPEVYARAMKHLEELYRSEGYLSATVGPAQVLRRRCNIYSPPGQCIPVGPRARPQTACLYDSIGRPVSQPPPDPRFTCKSDPAKGIRCEPNVTLRIPVKLGPRTRLYDLAFEGNKALYEKELEKAAGLELGAPMSLAEVEQARRRVLDAYAEQGYAFAEVDTAIDYSPDRTRARVRFIISEREQVRVAGIIVVGAQRTSESLIRSRVALTVGEPYRRSEVRETEERLATLGVFSSVTVGLEDPYVPAKRKMVVVTVQERLPQYLDIRPGFSTGEGMRIAFEYGHRNLGGEAIRLTLRVELGYLPTAFILEDDVRQKFEELDVGERLERRDTATVEFPDVGLGPLFRLSVEGVDVRDNSRDYGLTKDAGIVSLIYHPDPHFSAQIGGSLELNTAEIFGNEQKDALQTYVEQNPGLRDAFRVPQGTTLAIAQRIGFTWDRRDNPFDATRGTLLSASVEHVRANPVGETAQNAGGAATDVFAPTTSDFLRFTSRVAGYIRLNKRGLALAASFSWGYNLQLLTPCRDPNADHALGHCSQTYPDRLFFMGGVDTIRGFLQDSLIPEDVAQELLHPTNPKQPLTVDDVVIRGGDFFVNPRLELRIPLSGSIQTAVFLDAGNLWSDPIPRNGKSVKPWELRYAVGSGLRIGTPIGPLAFDYGFNVDRVLDALFPSRKNQRYWEDIGAFHFSIGLF